MKLHKLTPLMAYMLGERFLAELIQKDIQCMNQWQQDVHNGLYSFVAMHEWVQHGDLEQAAHHADIVDGCVDAMREYVEGLRLCG
jgi:hypothetical protein